MPISKTSLSRRSSRRIKTTLRSEQPSVLLGHGPPCVRSLRTLAPANHSPWQTRAQFVQFSVRSPTLRNPVPNHLERSLCLQAGPLNLDVIPETPRSTVVHRFPAPKWNSLTMCTSAHCDQSCPTSSSLCLWRDWLLHGALTQREPTSKNAKLHGTQQIPGVGVHARKT